MAHCSLNLPKLRSSYLDLPRLEGSSSFSLLRKVKVGKSLDLAGNDGRLTFVKHCTMCRAPGEMLTNI
ncbi:hypothetical protein AAY473_014407 [Plecturocebus cupreus]